MADAPIYWPTLPVDQAGILSVPMQAGLSVGAAYVPDPADNEPPPIIYVDLYGKVNEPATSVAVINVVTATTTLRTDDGARLQVFL